MTITPLEFGAWICLCCGFLLVRPRVSARGESLDVGSGRMRLVIGFALIGFGMIVLALALAHHFLRAH